MRSKSAEMKRQIYDFVNDWRRDEGRSPSLKAIADHLKVSRTTVYRYLIEMNEQGDLVYDGKVIDTKELNSSNTRLSGAMIVGSIPCGERSMLNHILRNMSISRLLFLATVSFTFSVPRVTLWRTQVSMKKT